MTGLRLIIAVVDEDGNEYEPNIFRPDVFEHYKHHYMLNKICYPFLYKTNPRINNKGFEKALHKIICFFINNKIGKVIVDLDVMEEGLKNDI